VHATTKQLPRTEMARRLAIERNKSVRQSDISQEDSPAAWFFPYPDDVGDFFHGAPWIWFNYRVNQRQPRLAPKLRLMASLYSAFKIGPGDVAGQSIESGKRVRVLGTSR